MESRGNLDLSARQGNAGTQAAHDIGPIEVRIDEHRVVLVAVISGERRTVGDRNVDLRNVTGSHPEEFGGRNARDCEWKVVNPYRLANRRRISAESRAPVVITKNRHLRCTCDIVAIDNKPARGWNNSEAAEEIAGDEFNLTGFSLPMDDQIERTGVLIREQRREDLIMVARAIHRRATGNPGWFRRLPVRRNCCRCGSGPPRNPAWRASSKSPARRGSSLARREA